MEHYCKHLLEGDKTSAQKRLIAEIIIIMGIFSTDPAMVHQEIIICC